MNRVFAKVDPLMLLILSAVVLAILLPARGDFADAFGTATNIAIALLFFLYGARLSPREAFDGVKNWRLHLVIIAFTFLFFPVLGVGFRPLEQVFGTELYLGILFLTLVPSTVQSSVAFTSIARGNVAGAIIAASLSNIVGVFLTPLLVMALMSPTGEVHIDTSVFGKIALQLLLPFIVGQLCRPFVKNFAQKKGTKIVDRGSITMVVYAAFSDAMVNDIWTEVNLWQILGLIIFAIILVSFMLWVTRFSAQRLGFHEADTIAIQFCGTKKSLASGLPMAAVIFGGSQLGLLILPLMIYHQVQLMVCTWLSSKYARRDPAAA
ncbi:MAG: bile acid:sodium symporter family protein [Corynebacterium sp.]|nr:bile acid:sodium symporter family protein [Corynebacterium sp.]